MLKQVMLGSGGIMLAAAIFASSVNTGSRPAEPAAEALSPPTVAEAPTTTISDGTAHTVQPPPFIDQPTGDSQFGAPMVSAQPVGDGVAPPPIGGGISEPEVITPDK